MFGGHYQVPSPRTSTVIDNFTQEGPPDIVSF
jgi:hypothetical protein